MQITAEGLNRRGNPLVIGSNDNLGNKASSGGPLVDMLHHWLSLDIGESLAGETGRSEPGRYDGGYLHERSLYSRIQKHVSQTCINTGNIPREERVIELPTE